jgi:hypothetical protein
MNQTIGDKAAIKFAVGFYNALGAGRSYEDCFEFGCTSVDLQGIPESETPVIQARPGRFQTEIKPNTEDALPIASSAKDSSRHNKNKDGQNRSVSVGGNVSGSSIQTGDHNIANVQFQPITLPTPESVDIRAELDTLHEILAKLETFDRRKIDNAFADAQEKVNKSQPDKNEVGKALDRALDYAKKAEGFTHVAEKLKPHLTKTTAWLGENWHKLLSTVGLIT